MFRLISAILNPLAQHDNNNIKTINGFGLRKRK